MATTVYISPTGGAVTQDGTTPDTAYAYSSLSSAESDVGNGGTILFTNGDYTLSTDQTWDAGSHADLTYKSLNLHGAKLKGISTNSQMRKLTIGSSATNTMKLDGFSAENMFYVTGGGTTTTLTITNFKQVDTHDGFRGLFYANYSTMGNFEFNSTVANSITNSLFDLHYGDTLNTTQQGQDFLFKGCQSTIVRNCTIYIRTPSSLGGGGAVADSSGTPSITNTILMSDDGSKIASSSIDTTTCNNCCIFQMHSGDTGGTNNVFADPQFVDPTNGDYRLRPSSPCINAGTAS